MSSALAPDIYGLRDAVVADPKMLAVIDTARNVAAHNASVLIVGETGVGKELVARLIHEHSPRSSKPWVDINCSALPEHLAESELFGYEKGAFSGADAAKPGLFEIANGGTLFLDEIGDLDPKVQAKLLRVLDGSPYYRLGGSRKVAVDVRVVAATNRDLDASVQQGTFRRDLFHRIGEVHIEVPPLRERPEDILALARHFLEQRNPEARFTPEALESLLQFEWRGNVRELRNLVLKLVIQSSALEITVDDILLQMGASKNYPPTSAKCLSSEITSIREVEREMIVRALELTNGNQTLAAERLGMPRRTFCRKLNQLQIAVDRRHRRATAENGAGRPPLNHRKELAVPVSITTASGRWFGASSSNLSAGGLGLENLQPPLIVLEELTAAFTLPGTLHQLEIRGVVVWSQPDGRAGIRFVGISELQTEILQQWIAGNLEPISAISANLHATEWTQAAALRSGS